MKNGFIKLTILSFILIKTSLCFSLEMTDVKFKSEGDVKKIEMFFDKVGISEDGIKLTHDKDNKLIILDIKDVKALAKALKEFDTSEFSGSVAFFSLYKNPSNPQDVRLSVKLRENTNSKVLVAGNKLTLAVESRFGSFAQAESSLQEAPSISSMEDSNKKGRAPKSDLMVDILENITSAGPKKYIGKKISINVTEIKIEDLLKMIADTSGFNIILGEDVKAVPTQTLSFTNVPWDEALDTILNINKLIAKKQSNILMVSTQEKAVKEKIASLQNKNIEENQEPLNTRIFPVSFAKLDDLKKILSEYQTPERGKISVDDRTNSLILKDTTIVLDKMAKMIETLDTQTPQILIEAKVVEANETYAKEVGLKNGLKIGYDPVEAIGDAQGPGFTFSSAPIPGGNFLGLNVALFRRIKNLDLELQLMEREQKGRIISSPKVITQNKKEATIATGETTNFRKDILNGTQVIATYEKISADFSLKVTPQVTNEGSIAMQVDINKTGFKNKPTDGSPPDSVNRSVSTNVLVDNGSTVVLGGIYKMERTTEVRGVPWLKDIPVLGWLFRNPDNISTSKDELIIFLTPRIINQEEAGFVDRNDLG
ncbi:MAG: type IV pilus secretin PilQ [Bacteriovoracaceae bacterium]|nr:type IV pilus secretin PilQ [Bacteriovoracaceae bacterium]